MLLDYSFVSGLFMSSSVPDRKSRHVTGRVPVMSETKYDVATAAQIAVFLGLLGFVGILIAIWLSNLLPEHQAIPMIMESGDGGWEDGSPDETLNVESPEDPSDDPSLSNDQSESQLEQITEQMVSLSDTAATLTNPNDFSDASGGKARQCQRYGRSATWHRRRRKRRNKARTTLVDSIC